MIPRVFSLRESRSAMSAFPSPSVSNAEHLALPPGEGPEHRILTAGRLSQPGELEHGVAESLPGGFGLQQDVILRLELDEFRTGDSRGDQPASSRGTTWSSRPWTTSVGVRTFSRASTKSTGARLQELRRVLRGGGLSGTGR